MIKYVITLTICAFINGCAAQKKSEIDLSQFSYLVGHMKNGEIIGNSTGYFIRKYDLLFFITTYHTCSCVDVFAKQPYPQEWDSIFIRSVDSGGETKMRMIDLQPIKKDRILEYFVDHPDICVFTFTTPPSNFKIHTIDSIVDLDKQMEDLDMNVISYGYERDISDSNDEMHKIVPTSYNGKLAATLKTVLFFEKINREDGKVYATKPGVKSAGRSGSPVFYKYNSGDKSKDSVLHFGGMVFGNDFEFGAVLIIKPKIIMDYLHFLYLRQ